MIIFFSNLRILLTSGGTCLVYKVTDGKVRLGLNREHAVNFTNWLGLREVAHCEFLKLFALKKHFSFFTYKSFLQPKIIFTKNINTCLSSPHNMFIFFSQD